MRSGEFHTSYRVDMAIFETARARWILTAFLVVLFVLPIFGSSYWLDVLNRAAIAVIAAMGLNILTGFTGQISLGNAAFMAIGAYTTAWLANRGLPFVIVIPVAGITAALAGMVFGVPSLRLKGLYLAMATLAAHFIVEFAVTHWDSVTGGVAGTSVPFPSLFGFTLASDRALAGAGTSGRPQRHLRVGQLASGRSAHLVRQPRARPPAPGDLPSRRAGDRHERRGHVRDRGAPDPADELVGVCVRIERV